jgi:DNA-binding transcriptional MocR family regulator
MWTPEIARINGPRYLAVASAIVQAIDSGELPPGAQLPPQRELADRLGVTVGTIGRAYALAKKRKLVSGEVGRGTFVAGDRPGVPSVDFSPAPQESRSSTSPATARRRKGSRSSSPRLSRCSVPAPRCCRFTDIRPARASPPTGGRPQPGSRGPGSRRPPSGSSSAAARSRASSWLSPPSPPQATRC